MIETDEQKIADEIKEIFDYFDKDQGGSIDSDELKECLKCLGENVLDEEVNDMIAAMDIDGDGTINYEEFLKEMKKRYGKRDPEREIASAFQRLSEEGTEFITRDGLLKIMNKIFKENAMNNEEAEDMIRVATKGQRNHITFNEFRNIMINGLDPN